MGTMPMAALALVHLSHAGSTAEEVGDDSIYAEVVAEHGFDPLSDMVSEVERSTT